MVPFNRVTIIGLGLIGGSLGMALRHHRSAKTVVGYSRKSATLYRAKQCWAIDRGTSDLRAAVRDAELVVIATPVDAIVPIARRVARFCRPGTVLTDVGSTKAEIVRQLERWLPPHAAFVGGHPIAGSDQRGIDAAFPELFDGALYVVTPTPRTSRRAVSLVTRLWRPLVGRVARMSPSDHDRIFASTSHLPHLVATCLMDAVPTYTLAGAAPSFLDMTRLAKSDPDVWDDIFLSNRGPLLDAMDRFQTRWRTLRTLLARADRARLLRVLDRANRQRHALKDS